MVTTRVEAAQCLKNAGGLKLVVFGASQEELSDTRRRIIGRGCHRRLVDSQRGRQKEFANG